MNICETPIPPSIPFRNNREKLMINKELLLASTTSEGGNEESGWLQKSRYIFCAGGKKCRAQENLPFGERRENAVLLCGIAR